MGRDEADSGKTREESAQATNPPGPVRVLALETSCDETAAAVVENGRTVLGGAIASQISVHARYGGVVPEIAARRHIEAIDLVIDQALEEAGLGLSHLDALGVTFGPGLVGALLTGVSYAKALAYALNLPLVPVNHIEGHLCANYLAQPDFEPPFVCLIASGGHSHIVEVRSYGVYRLLGQTRDDAAGEAFDKAARALGLPYPGGPLLDALAEHGDPDAFPLPRPRLDTPYDFSFSGVKTALVNRLRGLAQAGAAPDRVPPFPPLSGGPGMPCEVPPAWKEHRVGGVRAADIAASFRRVVVEALVDKTLLAAQDTAAAAVAAAGGVAANALLRRALRQGAQALGLRCCIPPPGLCTDNAAMIGSAAYYRLLRGETADLRLNAVPGAVLPAP